MAKTVKTLKSGIQVHTYSYPANKVYPAKEVKYYYFEGKELAWLDKDGVLFYNSKYWRNQDEKKRLKKIFSLILKRSKATMTSEYFNV